MPEQTIRLAIHHNKRERPLEESDDEPPSQVRIINSASEVQNLRDRIAALIEEKKTLQLQHGTEIIALKRYHAQETSEHEAEVGCPPSPVLPAHDSGKITLLKENHTQELFTTRGDHDRAISHLQLEHDKLADRLYQQDQEIVLMKEHHERSLALDNIKYNDEISALKEKFANELLGQNVSNNQQVAVIQEKHEQELNEFKFKHDQDLSTLKQAHDARQAELETEIRVFERRLFVNQLKKTTASESHAGQIDRLKLQLGIAEDKNAVLEETLDAARKETVSVEGRLVKSQEELGELKGRYKTVTDFETMHAYLDVRFVNLEQRLAGLNARLNSRGPSIWNPFGRQV
ncbi:hypothetical protein IW262DRAFT_1461550 [Armillaria fumosa]|nr:hypothetical protein IW262DRAFT_1461550 [Armillaria fumosa]